MHPITIHTPERTLHVKGLAEGAQVLEKKIRRGTPIVLEREYVDEALEPAGARDSITYRATFFSDGTVRSEGLGVLCGRSGPTLIESSKTSWSNDPLHIQHHVHTQEMLPITAAPLQKARGHPPFENMPGDHHTGTNEIYVGRPARAHDPQGIALMQFLIGAYDLTLPRPYNGVSEREFYRHLREIPEDTLEAMHQHSRGFITSIATQVLDTIYDGNRSSSALPVERLRRIERVRIEQAYPITKEDTILYVTQRPVAILRVPRPSTLELRGGRFFVHPIKGAETLIADAFCPTSFAQILSEDRHRSQPRRPYLFGESDIEPVPVRRYSGPPLL